MKYMTYSNRMTKTNSTAASDIGEMMAGWNKIQDAARQQFPNASEQEIYRITSGAMNHALGLKDRR